MNNISNNGRYFLLLAQYYDYSVVNVDRKYNELLQHILFLIHLL
jgi:hypothetical protein